MHASTRFLGWLLLASIFFLQQVSACPFCSAVSQTLSQEIDAADVAVIAKLVKLPPEADLDDPSGFDIDNPDSGMAEFEVLELVRAEASASNVPTIGDTIKVVYFGGNKSKKNFLVSGLAGSQFDWSTPLPLTQRGIDYIKKLQPLPEKGPERLQFFLDYLEDEDPLLAQDAYDEFGRAPYETVVAIGDRMDRQQLVDWIEDSQVGPTRRRLYLTMLGICGREEDIAILESLLQYDYQQLKPGLNLMLEVIGQTGPVVGLPVVNEMVRADVRRKQQCLDALIAAYLKLRGPQGLPLIEERFLANPAVDYTHVYSAVMALRFHGEETDVIPRPRLLQSVRLLLDNPEIADQVIPDLARWEDWSVMEKLASMFQASEKDAWVRQPVISYLLAACEQPLEVGARAKKLLAEIEALDPDAVKRARRYMSFGLLARVGSKIKPGDDTRKDERRKKDTREKSEALVVADTGNDKTSPDASGADISKTDVAQHAAQPVSDLPLSASTPLTPSAVSEAPSRVLIVGGPLIAGVVCFGIFALLLRGADVRSSENGS